MNNIQRYALNDLLENLKITEFRWLPETETDYPSLVIPSCLNQNQGISLAFQEDDLIYLRIGKKEFGVYTLEGIEIFLLSFFLNKESVK